MRTRMESRLSLFGFMVRTTSTTSGDSAWRLDSVYVRHRSACSKCTVVCRDLLVEPNFNVTGSPNTKCDKVNQYLSKF